MRTPYPVGTPLASAALRLPAKIARQHAEIDRILAELESLGEAAIDSESFSTTFQVLERAVGINFALEEKLLREAGVDAELFQGHFADHNRFIEFFSDTYLLAAARGQKTARDIVQELRQRIADHVAAHDSKLDALLAQPE